MASEELTQRIIEAVNRRIAEREAYDAAHPEERERELRRQQERAAARHTPEMLAKRDAFHKRIRQGDLLAETVDTPVTYKVIDAATSYVGMPVYLKYVDSDVYQAGTITRKDPGLTAEINGRKYITNKNGWGGHHSYQVFTT